MKRNIGKEFLFSKDYDYSQLDNGNGNKYLDGSAYYDGNDGTEIHIYSDGSGYYNGSDGSEGYLYSDGSGYFEGTDGSKGYKYSDGTGYFENENGDIEYFDYNSHNQDYDIENDLAYQVGKTLGEGFLGFIIGIATSYKNNFIENNEDDYEEEEIEEEYPEEDDVLQDENDYIKGYEIENDTPVFEKKETKFWFIYFGFLIILIVFLYFILYLYSTPGKGEIKISINAEDYIGTQYTEVEQKFTNMGFKNIKSIPKKDLIFGLLNKEGATAKITINNNDKFKKDEIFSKDADIVIYYHSFKK